jgi:hypothetical protein
MATAFKGLIILGVLCKAIVRIGVIFCFSPLGWFNNYYYGFHNAGLTGACRSGNLFRDSVAYL